MIVVKEYKNTMNYISLFKKVIYLRSIKRAAQLDKLRERIMTTTTKIVIKDQLTDEYYCVSRTAKDGIGNPTTGPDDFPYWSTDVNEAVNFQADWTDGKKGAENEMQFNDLTCDGTRSPVIITVGVHEQ